MSDFRDNNGNLFYIKENPRTGEEVKDAEDMIDFQKSQGFVTHHIESWSFIIREYKNDGGGVRSICTNKFIFDSERKAKNYLLNNDWVIDCRTSFYKRSSVKDGWYASEYATISCEKIKLRI